MDGCALRRRPVSLMDYYLTDGSCVWLQKAETSEFSTKTLWLILEKWFHLYLFVSSIQIEIFLFELGWCKYPARLFLLAVFGQ